MKRTKKETRIVLLGGRVFPALTNTLTDAENIKKLIPLTTLQSRYTVQDFQNALSENLKQKCISLADPHIEAEDIEAVKNKLSKIVKAEKDPIAIDITACPKIPALSAWDIARESNLSIIYVSAYSANIFRFNFKDGRYTLVRTRPRSMEVKNYLSLYGRKMRNNFNINWLKIARPKENTAYEICKYLVAQKEYGVRFLKFFRCIANEEKVDDIIKVDVTKESNCKRHFPQKQEVIEKFYEIFRFLVENGVITDLEFHLPNSISFNIHVHNQSFLNGKWLDYYIYRVLKDSGMFYNCGYSIGIPTENTENELDFIGVAHGDRIRNWVYVVEGKTGKVTGKDFDTLNTTADLIGGRAVVRFFVINEFTKNINKTKRNSLQKQAEERSINLIFADDLEGNKLIERFEKPKFQPI